MQAEEILVKIPVVDTNTPRQWGVVYGYLMHLASLGYGMFEVHFPLTWPNELSADEQDEIQIIARRVFSITEVEHEH